MTCFTRILGSETMELEAGLVWRVHALEPDDCLGKTRDWDRAGQRTQLNKRFLATPQMKKGQVPEGQIGTGKEQVERRVNTQNRSGGPSKGTRWQTLWVGPALGSRGRLRMPCPPLAPWEDSPAMPW